MRRLLMTPVVLMACGHGTNDPDVRSTGVASVGAKPQQGFDNPAESPVPAAAPDDHKASAVAIYSGRNYVAPSELAYSRKLKAVIYPACGGGEGPGEHCSLGGFSNAGATIDVDPQYQVSWQSYPGKTDQATIDKLAAALDQLDTVRLDRRPWTGTTPLVLPDYGTLSWDPAAKKLIATRDSATTKVSIEWGDRGGPVNLFWSPGTPLAVVQLRLNPASGGRETAQPGMQTENARTEGYVVFIQLVVVARP